MKDTKYWLWGGIGGLCVGVIFLFNYISTLIRFIYSIGSGISAYGIFIILLSILMVSVVTFLLGVFIGWIYGKIRNHNKISKIT